MYFLYFYVFYVFVRKMFCGIFFVAYKLARYILYLRQGYIKAIWKSDNHTLPNFLIKIIKFFKVFIQFFRSSCHVFQSFSKVFQSFCTIFQNFVMFLSSFSKKWIVSFFNQTLVKISGLTPDLKHSLTALQT